MGFLGAPASFVDAPMNDIDAPTSFVDPPASFVDTLRDAAGACLEHFRGRNSLRLRVTDFGGPARDMVQPVDHVASACRYEPSKAARSPTKSSSNSAPR
jgi:hypothetical protein